MAPQVRPLPPSGHGKPGSMPVLPAWASASSSASLTALLCLAAGLQLLATYCQNPGLYHGACI